jgi:hypothetical protein
MKAKKAHAQTTNRNATNHSAIVAALTIAERDAIDGAKSRLRGYLALMASFIEAEFANDGCEALEVLHESMVDAVRTIDTTFAAADKLAEWERLEKLPGSAR